MYIQTKHIVNKFNSLSRDIGRLRRKLVEQNIPSDKFLNEMRPRVSAQEYALLEYLLNLEDVS